MSIMKQSTAGPSASAGHSWTRIDDIASLTGTVGPAGGGKKDASADVSRLARNTLPHASMSALALSLCVSGPVRSREGACGMVGAGLQAQ